MAHNIAEFAGRQNIRNADKANQMASVVRQTLGKSVRYRELITNNGRPSGVHG